MNDELKKMLMMADGDPTEPQDDTGPEEEDDDNDEDEDAPDAPPLNEPSGR